jgi:hypothetical protein
VDLFSGSAGCIAEAFRYRQSRQRCFDEQPRCQKGSTDNLRSGIGSPRTFIIVPAMLSDSSRTSDVNPFRFRNFQPRNDYLDALVRDCNFHDTTRRIFATQPRASARALLQFQ